MTYSMDLRQRALSALDDGQSIHAVAIRFSVACSTVRQWRDRAAAGTLQSAKPGPKQPRKLTAADDAIIRRLIASKPGITVKEILPHLPTQVVGSTVYRRLAQLKIVLKKSR